MNLPKLAFVNWKTTLSSSLLLLAYIVVEFLVPLISGQPVDLSKVLTPEVVLALVALTQFLTGAFTRDADKSSQDNGARPAAKPEAAAETVDAEIARIRAGL